MNQIHSASRRQIAMHIRVTHHYKQQCCNAPSEAIALKSTRVQDEGRITKPAGHGPGPSGPRDGRGMGALVVVFLSSVEIPVAWPGHTVTFRAICTHLFGGDDLLKSPSIFVSAAFEGLASQLFLFGCSLLSPSLLLYLFFLILSLFLFLFLSPHSLSLSVLPAPLFWICDSEAVGKKSAYLLSPPHQPGVLQEICVLCCSVPSALPALALPIAPEPHTHIPQPTVPPRLSQTLECPECASGSIWVGGGCLIHPAQLMCMNEGLMF